MKNIEKNSPEALINLACLMAAVDNEIHPKEIEMIKEFSNELGVSEVYSIELLDEIMKKNEFEDLCLEAIQMISSSELQKKALNMVTKVSTADNFIKEKEYLFMQLAVDNWNIFN